MSEMKGYVRFGVWLDPADRHQDIQKGSEVWDKGRHDPYDNVCGLNEDEMDSQKSLQRGSWDN